jgi:hypothetical protein
MFKPKFGTSGVRYSGFNAFVSLNNVVNNMNKQTPTAEITTPAAITNTELSFLPTFNAPISGLSSNIQTSAGLPVTVFLDSINFEASTGRSDVTIGLVGPLGPGPIAAAPVFQDAIGNVPVGIAIVASLPITQNQQYVSNPEINLVAVIPPPGALTGWTSSDVIVFDCAPLSDYGNRKLGYTEEDLVQFKAYLIGQNGSTQPLNSIKTTIAA